MGLPARFKRQPRWKHADPAVRMAGVQELPDDSQDLLASIAREDPDPRVRRLAVSKLGSVAVLAGALRDASEAASRAAVEGLAALPSAEAQKQLVLIAKSARLESVARRALDATGGDPRSLGTIARRSDHAAIRLEGLCAV